MIRTIYHDSVSSPAENRVVGDWVSALIFGSPGRFERYATMAVVDGGNLIAANVYHNYSPETGVIEISTAAVSKRWITRPVAYDGLRYPFDVLGCQMVVTRTSEHNEAALAVNRWLGFSFTRIERLRGRNEAEIIGTLTDDAWREGAVYKRAHKG